MKVTMLGTFPPIKGISRTYCLPLAEALSARVAVDFVSFSHIYPERFYPGGTREPGAEPLPDFGPDLTVRTPLAWYNPFGWIWTGLRVPGDVLHAQWWTYYLAPVEIAVLAAAKLRRKPVVMTVHNVLGHETNRLDRMLTRIACRFADVLIVHTEENKRQLVETFHIAPERVEVVPFGALTGYDDAPLSREDARRELGLEPSDRAVLFFGNIRDYKGLDVMLRAMPALLERVPRAKLVVAGTCWTDWERYDRLIDELGVRRAVKLDIGYVPTPKVKVYFRAADVCALAYTHFEAQSGPGNIALAFGTPMVVSRTGGLPALVRDERAIVPPGDPAALAATLADCLLDPDRLARMSTDSGEIAKQVSWEAIAERTVAIYGRL